MSLFSECNGSIVKFVAYLFLIAVTVIIKLINSLTNYKVSNFSAVRKLQVCYDSLFVMQCNALKT